MTEKKLAANRQNALHSTGPKSEVGKKRSRLNAVKHGVYSKIIVDPEEAIQLKSIYLDLIAEYHPKGVLESYLVKEIAELIVRKERYKAAEAQTLNAYRYMRVGHETNVGDFGTALIQDAGAYRAIPSCLAAEDRLSHRLESNFEKLINLQAKRGQVAGTHEQELNVNPRTVGGTRNSNTP